MGFGKCHLFFGCDIMKFFIISLFLLLLLDGPQGSTLSHRRSIRALNTTLQTNFNGTYQRRNPCNNAEIETSSYAATHEFRHYTKEDDWSDYSRKCSAIISSFLQAIGNLVRFNNKQNGTFNFHINTSITQKQDANCHKSSCNSFPTIIIEATDGEINQRSPPATETPPCERKSPFEGHTSNEADGIRNVPSPSARFGKEHGNQKSATLAYRKPATLNSREQEILYSEPFSTTPAYQPDSASFQDIIQGSERETLTKHEKISTTGNPLTAIGTEENVSPFSQYNTDTEGPSRLVFNTPPQNLQTELDKTSTRPKFQTETHDTDAIRPEEEFTTASTPAEIQPSPDTFNAEIPSEPHLIHPQKPESFHSIPSSIPPGDYNQQTQFIVPKTTPNVPYYHSTPEAIRPGSVETLQSSLVYGQQQPNINSGLLNDNLHEPIPSSQQPTDSFTPANLMPTTGLSPARKTVSGSSLGHSEYVPPAIVGSTIPPTADIRFTEITPEGYSSPRPAEIPSTTRNPLSTPVPEPVGFSPSSITTYKPFYPSSLPPQIPNVPTFQQPQNRFVNSADPQILSGATTPTQSENQATDSFLPPAATPEYDELSDGMPVTKPPLAEDNFFTDAVQSYNYDEQSPFLLITNPIPTTPPTSFSGLPPDYNDSDAGIPPESNPTFFSTQPPTEAPVFEQTKPQIADFRLPSQTDVSSELPSNIGKPINDKRPPYSAFAPKQQFLAEETSDYNEFPSTISPQTQNFFEPKSQQTTPVHYSEQNLGINEFPDKSTGTQLPPSHDRLPTVPAPFIPPKNEFAYPDPTFNPNERTASNNDPASTFQTDATPNFQLLHSTTGPNLTGPKSNLIEPLLRQKPIGDLQRPNFPPTTPEPELQFTPQLPREMQTPDSIIHSQQTPVTFIQPESQIPHAPPSRNFPIKFPSEQQPAGNLGMTRTQTTPSETFEIIGTEAYTTAGPETQPALEYASPYESDNGLPDSNTYNRQSPNTFRPIGNAPFVQFPPTFPPNQQPSENYDIPKAHTFPPTVYEKEKADPTETQFQTTIGPTRPPMEYAGFGTTDSSDPVFYDQQPPGTSVVPESQVSNDSQLNQSPSTISPEQKSQTPQFPLQLDRTTTAPTFYNQQIPGIPIQPESQFSSNVPFRQFTSTFPPEQHSVGDYEMPQSQEDPQLKTSADFESPTSETTVFPYNQRTPFEHPVQPDSYVGPNAPLKRFPSQGPDEIVQPGSTSADVIQDPQSHTTFVPEFQPPLEYGNDGKTGLSDSDLMSRPIPNSYSQSDPEFTGLAPFNQFPSSFPPEQQSIENYKGPTTPPDTFEDLQTNSEMANEGGTQMRDSSYYNQQTPNFFGQPDSLISNAPNNQFSTQQPLQNYETDQAHSAPVAGIDDSKLQTAPPQPLFPLQSYRTTGLPDSVFYDQPNTSIQPESEFTRNAPIGQYSPTVEQQENYNLAQSQTTPAIEDSVLQTTEAPGTQNLQTLDNDRMTGLPDPIVYNQGVPGSSIPPDSQLLNNAPFDQFPSAGSPEQQVGNYEMEQPQPTSVAMYEDPRLQTMAPPFANDRTPVISDPDFYNQQAPDGFNPTSSFTSLAPERELRNRDIPQPLSASTTAYEDPQLQRNENETPVQYNNDRTTGLPNSRFYNEQTSDNFAQPDSGLRVNAPINQFPPTFPAAQEPTGNYDMMQNQFTSTEDPQLYTTQPAPQYANDRTLAMSDPIFYNQQTPNIFTSSDSQPADNEPFTSFAPERKIGNRGTAQPQGASTTKTIETEFPTTAGPNTFVPQVAASEQYPPPMSQEYQPAVLPDRSSPFQNSTSPFRVPEIGNQVVSPSYNNQPVVYQDEFQAETKSPLEYSDGNFGPTTQAPFYGPTLMPYNSQPLGNTEGARTTFSRPDPNTSVGLEVQPLPSTASGSPYPGQILNDNLVTPIPNTSGLNSEQAAPVISSPIRQSPADIYISDSLTTGNPNGDDYQDPLYFKSEIPSFMTPTPISNYATSKQTHVPSEQSNEQPSTDPSVFGGDQPPTNNYQAMAGEPQAYPNSDKNLIQPLNNGMLTQTSDIYSTVPVEYQTTESTQDIPSEMSSAGLGRNEPNIGHTASPPPAESYTPYSVPVFAPTQPIPFTSETISNNEPQMTDQFEQGLSTVAPVDVDVPQELQRKFSPRPIFLYGTENPHFTNLKTTPFPDSASNAADAYSETVISDPASQQFSSEHPPSPLLPLNEPPVVENPRYTEVQPSGYGVITPALRPTTFEEPAFGSPTPVADLSQRQSEHEPSQFVEYPNRPITGRPKPVPLEPTAYTQPPHLPKVTIYESEQSDPNQAQSMEPYSEGQITMPERNFFTGSPIPQQIKGQLSFIPDPTFMSQPEQVSENRQSTQPFYGDEPTEVYAPSTTAPQPSAVYPMNQQQRDIRLDTNFPPSPTQRVPTEQFPNIGLTALPPQSQRDAFTEYNKEIISTEPTVAPMAEPWLRDSNQMSNFSPPETYPTVGQQPVEERFGHAGFLVDSFVTPQPPSAQTVSDSNEYVSYAQNPSSELLEPQSLISTVGNDQPLQGTFQPSYVPESQTKTTLPYSNEPSMDLKPSSAASEQEPLDSPLETTPWILTRNQTTKPNDFQNLDSTFAQPENIYPFHNFPSMTSGTTTPSAFAVTVPPGFPSEPNPELRTPASHPAQPLGAYDQIPSNVPPQFPPTPYLVDSVATTDYPSPSPPQSSVDYYSDDPRYGTNPPNYTPQINTEEFQNQSPVPETNIPLNYAEDTSSFVAEGTPTTELQGSDNYVDKTIPTSQPNLKSRNVQEETPMYLPSPFAEPQPQPSLDYATEFSDYKTADGMGQTSRTFDSSSPLLTNTEAFTSSSPNSANTFQPEPQTAFTRNQNQINTNTDFSLPKSRNSGEEFNTPTVSYPSALGTTDMVTYTPVPDVGQGVFNNPSTPRQAFSIVRNEPVGMPINSITPLPNPFEIQSVYKNNIPPEIQPTAANYDGKTNAYQSSPAPQPQTTLKYVEQLSDDNTANISPDQMVTASPEFEETPAMTYDQFSPSRNPEIPGTQYQPIPESQLSPLSEGQRLGSFDPQGPYTMPPNQQTGGVEAYDSETITTYYPSPQTSQPQPNFPLNYQAPVNGIPFQPIESPVKANQSPEQMPAPPFLDQSPTAIPPPPLADELISFPAYPKPESQLSSSNYAPQVTEAQQIYNSGEQSPENGVNQPQNDQDPQVLNRSYEMFPTTPQMADRPIADSSQPSAVGPSEPVSDANRQPEISTSLQQTLNQPTPTYFEQNLNDGTPASGSLPNSASDFDGSQTQPPFLRNYPGSNLEESGFSPSYQPSTVGPQTQPPFMSFPPTFERQTTPPFVPYSTEPPFNQFQERTIGQQETTGFPTDSPIDPQLPYLNNNNNNNDQLLPLEAPTPAYSFSEVPSAESSSYSDPQTSVRNSQEVILENPTSPGTPVMPADYDEGFSTRSPGNWFEDNFETTPNTRNPENVLTGRQPFDGLTRQPGSHDSQLPILPQTDSPLDFEEPSRRPVIFTPDSEPSTYSPLQEETPSNPLLQTLESHLSIPLHESPQPSSFPEQTALGQTSTTPVPNYSFPPEPQHQYGVSAVPPYFRRPEFDRNFVTFQPQPNAGVNTSQDVTNAPRPDSRALVSDPTTPSNEPGEDYVSCCGRYGNGTSPLLCPFDPVLKGNMTAPSYYILISKLPVEHDKEEHFRVESVYLGDGTPLDCSRSVGKPFPTSRYIPVPVRGTDTVKLRTKTDIP